MRTSTYSQISNESSSRSQNPTESVAIMAFRTVYDTASFKVVIVPKSSKLARKKYKIRRTCSATWSKSRYSDHWDSIFQTMDLGISLLPTHNGVKSMVCMDSQIDLSSLVNHVNTDSGGSVEGSKPARKCEEEMSRKRPALEPESGELESSRGAGYPDPSTKRLKKAFACPYYKNNPKSYSDCQGWHNYNIHHVKEHIKTVHLRPHPCGRPSRISKIRTLEESRDTSRRSSCSISPNMDSGHRLADELGFQSAKTWQEIYISLFPQHIPYKFWGVHNSDTD